jgi:hypothetical protein
MYPKYFPREGMTCRPLPPVGAHPKEYFHPGEYFYHKGMTRRGPFPSVRALPPVGAREDSSPNRFGPGSTES